MKNNKGTIMVQGTASDSGKSTLAAALCRIYARRGIKTAPFKAWNMAADSYLTKKGAEIGIAQALQAQAAGIEAEAEMQPILVKVMQTGQTQLIIKGKLKAELNYQKKKSEFNDLYKKTIKNSLKKLKENNELIIIEGSGSPVEINRKTLDFANMFTAQLYNSPVLLISSIEKGGCLASLVGTLKLLTAEQRNLVKGLIINKFRGDFELLKPALNFLKDYTGKEVMAVLSYLKDLNLPEEDSVSMTEKNTKFKKDKSKSYQQKLEENLDYLADQVEAEIDVDRLLDLSRGRF